MIHRVMLATSALALACTGAAARSGKPASSLTITNARTVPVVDVTVRVGQGAVTLKRPLAPGAKATLKLPKMSGCTVSIFALFEDEGVAEMEEFDTCRERTVRFTD
jgi:hypothetical protein